MVLVTDLLTTSAISWRTLFGFLHEFHQCLGPDAEAKIDTLRLDKSVIDRAERYFEGILEFLHQRHELGWLVCSTDDSKDRVDQIVKSITADFVRLKSEAAALSTSCSTAITIEMSTMSAQFTKAGLDQAKQVRYLTILAFIFIPASFIATVFALVFISPYPPMWKFFATLIPFTAFFVFLTTWSLLANWLSALLLELRARFRV
jgi:Mg2+ and Co2+ transporter CorA